MISRINCSFFKGCSKCQHATLVKKNYWEDKLYVCKILPKKHKEIAGKNCGSFRCRKYGSEYILCES